MRFCPKQSYIGLPCSYVATGCAWDDANIYPFGGKLPEGLHDDGYLNLNDINGYVRQNLNIQKKEYFARAKRPTLSAFLATNDRRAIVCVYGHVIYVHGHDYWSFYDNDRDRVVCIWYIKERSL